MASTGQTLENPASGERITIRQTAADTHGELLAIDLELPAGRRVPGWPAHPPAQEERFEVVEGTMRFKMGRERVVAGPARSSSSPPASRTTSPTPVTSRRSSASRCDPPLKMEPLFETAVGLAEEGRTMLGGIPKPLDLALFIASSRTKCRRPSRRAGCSASSSHRWPGSPGTGGSKHEHHASKPTLVLGGTGKTGRRVVERLTERGLPVRVGSRSGKPPFDWEDRSTWAPALEGVGAVYVSYYPDIAMPGAVEAIARVRRAGAGAASAGWCCSPAAARRSAELAEQAVRDTGAD